VDYKCNFYLDIPELKETLGVVSTDDELPFAPYPGLWLHFYGNRNEVALRVSEVIWHMHDLDFMVSLDAVKPMALRDREVFLAAKTAPSGVRSEDSAFWKDFFKEGGWDVELGDEPIDSPADQE
jgi:hypothetical protein